MSETLQQIIELVRRGKGKAAIQMLQQNNYVYSIRIYEGMHKGSAESYPDCIGTYDTVRHGRLSIFRTCSIPEGDSMHDGLTVMVNNLYLGDAQVPSWYMFLAIKE